MNELNINLPISKIDEEQRMVWGYATSEALDSQGDVVDYQASKKAFSNWVGNIREMHDSTRAVGKAIDIQFDDENKAVMIGAKISESEDGENAWIKIKEGVLTGFSIGGKVNKILKENIKMGGKNMEVNRIVDYDLGETSVVDNPANPRAKFVMVKSMKGSLYKVEVAERATDPHPYHWWYKFLIPIEKGEKLYNESRRKEVMAKKEIRKDVWDASMILDCAKMIEMYIESEKYEKEDTTQAEQVLAGLKALIQKELDDPEYFDAMGNMGEVEMSNKISNLKKGVDMKKSDEEEKVESTEEVEETETPQEETEEVTEGAKSEEKEKETVEEPEETEEKAEETSEEEKSVKVSDLEKAIEKVMEKREEKIAKSEVASIVKAAIKPLAEKLEQLEKTAAPAKIKASFVDVEKGESKDDVEVSDLVKRAKELEDNPNTGTVQERAEVAVKLRKAQLQGKL